MTPATILRRPANTRVAGTESFARTSWNWPPTSQPDSGVAVAFDELANYLNRVTGSLAGAENLVRPSHGAEVSVAS